MGVLHLGSVATAPAAGRFLMRLAIDRPGVVVTHLPFLYQPSFIFHRTRAKPRFLSLNAALSPAGPPPTTTTFGPISDRCYPLTRCVAAYSGQPH